MVEKLVGVAVFLVLGSIVLRSLERFFPARDGAGAPMRTRLLSRERLTDVAHVAFNTLVTQPIVKVAGFVVFVVFMLVFRLPHEPSHLYDVWHRDARIAHLPLAIQIPLAIVFADFASYWVHRAFHHGWLWKLHAVHHSSRALDWLAGARNHPLGEALQTMMGGAILLVAGFDPRVLAVTAPIGLYAILLHANVSFGTSWVRFVITTPLFHRWHHAHPDALPIDRRDGVNFAGLFPFWDLLFGTFHAPRTQPASFGEDANVPPRFVSQLVFPFRRGP
jgi:sterol desaturase/sphingolipid hydroxylase (fatty acid hydroxylase superfamily)